MSLVITNNINQFKTVFDVLKNIIKEGRIDYSPYGIKISSKDITSTMFVKCNINKFKKYKSSDNKVGIDFENFNDLLKTINNDEILEIFIKNNLLVMSGKKSQESKKGKKYKIPCIDCCFDTEEIPNKKNWDVKIKMQGREYAQLLNNLSKSTSDVLTIKCTKNKVSFKSGHPPNPKLYFGYEEEEDFKITYNSNSKVVKNSYYIDNLLMTKKIASLCDKVVISLDEIMKIFFKFDIGKFSIFVVPKTEDDYDYDPYDESNYDIDENLSDIEII